MQNSQFIECADTNSAVLGYDAVANGKYYWRFGGIYASIFKVTYSGTLPIDMRNTHADTLSTTRGKKRNICVCLWSISRCPLSPSKVPAYSSAATTVLLLLLLRWLSIEFVRWKNRLSNFRIAQFLFRKQQDMQYISLLKTRNPTDATNLHKCSQQRLPVIQSVFLNSNFLVTAKHSKLPLNYVWITFYFYSFRASTF